MLPGLENHSEYVEVTTCACSFHVGVVHVVARQDTLFVICWCTPWARTLHDLLAILSVLVATWSVKQTCYVCVIYRCKPGVMTVISLAF